MPLPKEPVNLDAATCYSPPSPSPDGEISETPYDFGPNQSSLALDDYEIVEEIARGGMGIVYRAKQTSLSRTVAIKMILAGRLACPDDVQRFHAEAQAAANLRHPAIVAVYEIGEAHGQHYFTMEFIEGESLAARLARGPLKSEDAARLMKTVAEAIQHAHTRSVIHRDIKPGNILLDSAGHPHVTDFGLAQRGTFQTPKIHTAEIVGTPNYMPPEQAGNRPDSIAPTADIYSLGAVLYAALTARPPFNAPTPLETLLQVLEQDPAWPSTLNPLVPRDLESIAMKCLRKSPAERYRTVAEIAEDLERFLQGEPVHARKGDTLYFAMQWLRKHLIVAGVSGTVVLLMIALLTVTAWAYRTEVIHRMELEIRLAEAEERVAGLQSSLHRAKPNADSHRHDYLVQVQKLIAKSESLRVQNPEISVVLASEALRLAADHSKEAIPESRKSLLDALAAFRSSNKAPKSSAAPSLPSRDDLEKMTPSQLLKAATHSVERSLSENEINKLLEE